MSDDEDACRLSAETFAALQEFYKEQEIREHNLLAEGKENNSTFAEDWVKR